jgi:hypothetical protein
METSFVTYDVLNSLQKECMPFLGSFAKTCMIFGILLNKISLIETSYSKLFELIFLLKKTFKNCKKYIKMQNKYIFEFSQFF